MIQKILIQILLFPIAVIYGIAILIRNSLYNTGFLKRITFSVPVITIGNLSVGGTGKTPHIEYLIEKLSPYLKIAVQSRGYKRKSKGFRVVNSHDTVTLSGDEPLQIKRKFPEIAITVSESRTVGIPELLKYFPTTQLILLDDAYQHLSVKAQITILLTEYKHPFYQDYLLPVGRLREWRSGYRRANSIIVTKCPPELSDQEKSHIISKINPRADQKVFFSTFQYLHPYNIWNQEHAVILNENVKVLLVTGIARSAYIEEYVGAKVAECISISFEDHHYFDKYEIGQLKTKFDAIQAKNKIILTTEKDATRLEIHRQFLQENNLPIFVLPILVRFFDEEKFITDIQNRLLAVKV